MFREATNNPLTRTDDYTLLNARLSLLPNDGRWDVSAYVYNATDEEYFQEAFFSDLIGSVAGLAGAPRTYGLSFTYNLGQ
jgi:iron complex outermembrane receptor protein